MDRIHVRDIEVQCIVGTKPVERTTKQRVRINLVLDIDLAPAAQSDRIEDTLNYKDLKDQVVEMTEQSRHFLIERLASEILDACLKNPQVQAATVTVDKPDALTGARSVGVELSRSKPATGPAARTRGEGVP